MEISTAANIAEIAGGVAILISLIYVGYQIRQSNRIATTAALQSVLDRFSDRSLVGYLEHPEIGEILTRGHNSTGLLSNHEIVIFNAWLLREVIHMQNIMQLHKSGFLDSVDYQTWLAFTTAQITTPGGMESWNQQKVSLTPTIVETLEDYMQKNPDAPSLIDIYPSVYAVNSD
jgi:hypothetical protein